MLLTKQGSFSLCTLTFSYRGMKKVRLVLTQEENFLPFSLIFFVTLKYFKINTLAPFMNASLN